MKTKIKLHTAIHAFVTVTDGTVSWPYYILLPSKRLSGHFCSDSYWSLEKWKLKISISTLI